MIEPNTAWLHQDAGSEEGHCADARSEDDVIRDGPGSVEPCAALRGLLQGDHAPIIALALALL